MITEVLFEQFLINNRLDIADNEVSLFGR